jgi:hypothetical protein
MNITPTVKQLLIINILFFIGTQFVGEGAYDYLALFFIENAISLKVGRYLRICLCMAD